MLLIYCDICQLHSGLCEAQVGQYGTWYLLSQCCFYFLLFASRKVDACFCEIAHIGVVGLALGFAHCGSRSNSL